MLKIKRNIKKILTAVSCVLIVAAIVSLCSVAYLRDTTDAQSHSIRFANVSVSQQTGMGTQMPQENDMDDVDTNGYYISLSDVVTNKGVEYSPTVTNNGEKEIYAYLVVTKPKYNGECVVDNFDVNSENVTSTGENVVNGKWIYLMTKSYTDYKADVYGYSEKLGAGQTTKPLCTKFKVIKPTAEYADNDPVLVNDKYAKFTLQTSGMGVQSAETALSFRNGDKDLYQWSDEKGNGDEVGRRDILYRVWNNVVSEQQYYINDKIYKVA